MSVRHLHRTFQVQNRGDFELTQKESKKAKKRSYLKIAPAIFLNILIGELYMKENEDNCYQ